MTAWQSTPGREPGSEPDHELAVVDAGVQVPLRQPGVDHDVGADVGKVGLDRHADVAVPGDLDRFGRGRGPPSDHALDVDPALAHRGRQRDGPAHGEGARGARTPRPASRLG